MSLDICWTFVVICCHHASQIFKHIVCNLSTSLDQLVVIVTVEYCYWSYFLISILLPRLPLLDCWKTQHYALRAMYGYALSWLVVRALLWWDCLFKWPPTNRGSCVDRILFLNCSIQSVMFDVAQALTHPEALCIAGWHWPHALQKAAYQGLIKAAKPTPYAVNTPNPRM